MAGCFSPIACGKNGKPLEDDGDDDPANTRERKARLDLVRGASRGNITDKFLFGRTLGECEASYFAVAFSFFPMQCAHKWPMGPSAARSASPTCMFMKLQ